MLGSTSLLGGCQFSEQQNKQALKCFIVSDAHIGWDGKEQPSVEEQKKLVRHIVQQFPDLDLAFDTGDAHHGSLNEAERVKARSQWLDAIANQFSVVPFHYVVGNHELGKGESDPEKVACTLGSMPLRPYYAFDSHGIHFVSLPELFNTILISRETLNWLALDLMYNKNKTTIILSHNSIKGTTYNNGESGYRCLANSEEVKALLAQNPQVVAWFHGHNHQYEIVNLKDQVHVSNGRIGGFDPPKKWGDFGQGHLGGIYFEISKDQLNIKAYSATKKAILSELGFPHLQLKKNMATTFAADQRFHYYLGHGMSTNGMRHKIYQHYLSTTDSQLVWQRQIGPINENPDLHYPTEYEFGGRQQIKMLGYQFSSRDIKYATSDGNLQVKNPKQLEEFTLTFPNHRNRKTKLFKRGSYYVCENGQRYKLVVEFSSLDLNEVDLSVLMDVHTMPYQRVIQKSYTPTKISGQHATFELAIELDAVAKDTLYMRFNLRFKGFPEYFAIQSIGLYPSEAKDPDVTLSHCSIKMNINAAENSGLMRLNVCQQLESEMQFSGLGENVIAWLVQVRDIQWQIRNAVGVMQDNTLTVQRRNRQTEIHNNSTIILTPVQPLRFYLNQMDALKQADIRYLNTNTIEIRLQDYSEDAQLIFVCPSMPTVILGGEVKAYQDGMLRLQPKANQITVGLAA